jgi:hypothetical protein
MFVEVGRMFVDGIQKEENEWPGESYVTISHDLLYKANAERCHGLPSVLERRLSRPCDVFYCCLLVAPSGIRSVSDPHWDDKMVL